VSRGRRPNGARALAAAALTLATALALAACGPAPPDPTGPPDRFVEAVVEQLFTIADDYLPPASPEELQGPEYRATGAFWDEMVAEMAAFVTPFLHPEVVPDWRWPPAREACVTVWAHALAAKLGGRPEVRLVRLDGEEDRTDDGAAEPAAATPTAVLEVALMDVNGHVEARYSLLLVKTAGAWQLRHPPSRVRRR